MFKFKDIIFNLFSRFEKRDDPFKDSEGKGTNQRYHEMLADDIDENMIPMIKNLLDNTFIPATMFARYIPYMEQMLGITVISQDLDIRREMIKNWIPLMTIKGTLPSYQLIFKILGFQDIDIESLTFKQGFDSPVTFDDQQRRFDDSKCQNCTYYDLYLSATFPLTAEVYEMIKIAVKVVEPINAKLRSIVFNGIVVDFAIFVDDNGDLIVDDKNTDVIFILKPNGDLTISKSDAPQYFIDNGDLKKN